MSDRRPSPPVDAHPNSEIDLARLLQLVWASRKWVAGGAAIAVFLALFYLANTFPTYQADALVQLEEKSGSLALPTALSDLVDQSPRTATEISIINSRLVLRQVVAALNLDWSIAPAKAPLIGNALMRYNLPLGSLPALRRYGHRGDILNLSLLEVPPQWVDKDITLDVVDAGSFVLTLPDGSQINGHGGELLRNPGIGFALQVAELQAETGRQFIIRHLTEREAIEAVQHVLSVAEVGKQSGILQARLTDTDPTRAMAILNGIVQAYVGQNIARSAAQAESSLSFIETQIPQTRGEVDAAESALNDYRQQQKSVDLSFETEAVLTQITKIQADLADLQVKEDDIKQRYKPSHPVYQQLLDQRKRLQDTLASLQKQVAALPETQREVLNLTSKLELARKAYTDLLTREQEVKVLKASTVGNVRIVDDAVASVGTVAPRKALILMAALLLGMMAGAAIGLARIILRKTVRSADVIEQMGLAVFATINQAKVPNGSKGEVNQILAMVEPTDLSVEGLRSLRTSLQFGMLDAKTKSLAITSTAPGAGKSFTSVNLAAVTAQAGQRVCVVDSDLRRGQLRKAFGGHKNEAGLSEYLAGEKTLDEVLRKSELDGLMYIATGRYPPNPSELLMRRTFAELVAELDQRFDFTIFDCPPVLAVTDPVIIGRQVGGTMAVVRYDMTAVAEIQAMIKTCDAAGLSLVGTILNGFDPRKAREGGYAYSYNYRYDYKQRQD